MQEVALFKKKLEAQAEHVKLAEYMMQLLMIVETMQVLDER